MGIFIPETTNRQENRKKENNSQNRKIPGGSGLRSVFACCVNARIPLSQNVQHSAKS